MGVKRSFFLWIAIPLLIVTLHSCNTSGIPDNYTLTTNISPAGAGEISPAGGDEYEPDAEVEIEAVPAGGYVFVHWEGDLEGSENPVTITFDADKEITAVFSPREYPLNIDVRGEGGIREEIVPEKSKDYEHGTVVALTAEPEEGWSFERWEGDLEGSENPETLTIDESKTIRAVFEAVFVSHGYVEGVTPDDDPAAFDERSYPVVQSDWEGPGGDNRWLGTNLGATAEPESVEDESAESAGWYFRFNREQGYYHDGSFGRAEGFPIGPASRSTIRENSDWGTENDPCRKLLGGNWRIPSEAEWKAAAGSGAPELNLHAAGQLSPSFGHPLDSRGEYGGYWSSTQFNRDNGIIAEIDDEGRVEETERIQKHYGLPIRCIEE